MDQDNLYRYLDARFDGIEKRLDAQHNDYKELSGYVFEKLSPRLRRLENWRSYLTGASIVIFAILAWLAEMFSSR